MTPLLMGLADSRLGAGQADLILLRGHTAAPDPQGFCAPWWLLNEPFRGPSALPCPVRVSSQNIEE
jgi:hypothetical protein